MYVEGFTFFLLTCLEKSDSICIDMTPKYVHQKSEGAGEVRTLEWSPPRHSVLSPERAFIVTPLLLHSACTNTRQPLVFTGAM